MGRRCPAKLTKAFVEHNCSGIGQIEAPNALGNRDSQMLCGVGLEEGWGQAAGFASENQGISWLKFHIPEGFFCPFRQKPDPIRSTVVQKAFYAFVAVQGNVRPVIQTCSSYIFIFKGKSQLSDEVKRGSGACAGSGDRTSVSRNLGFDQCDLERRRVHGLIVTFRLLPTPSRDLMRVIRA